MRGGDGWGAGGTEKDGVGAGRVVGVVGYWGGEGWLIILICMWPCNTVTDFEMLHVDASFKKRFF